MPKFIASARYCTRNGNPASWTGTLDAADLEAALRLAQTTVEKRHRGASKIDLTISLDTRPAMARSMAVMPN